MVSEGASLPGEGEISEELSVLTPVSPSKCSAATIRYAMALEAAGYAEMQSQALGSQPLDERDFSYTPIPPQHCAVCYGTAELTSAGYLAASECVSSGSCERSWIEQHPEHYYDETGKRIAAAAPCGGYRCAAVLLIGGEGSPGAYQLLGQCSVDRQGEIFRLTGYTQLNTMPLTSPDEFEPYDGEPDC